MSVVLGTRVGWNHQWLIEINNEIEWKNMKKLLLSWKKCKNNSSDLRFIWIWLDL